MRAPVGGSTVCDVLRLFVELIAQGLDLVQEQGAEIASIVFLLACE